MRQPVAVPHWLQTGDWQRPAPTTSSRLPSVGVVSRARACTHAQPTSSHPTLDSGGTLELLIGLWSCHSGAPCPTSDSLVVCDVDPMLTEMLRKFRFRKETNNAAILMKIDKERQLVVLEEELQDVSPEELRSELPERQPRFVVYSYKYVHDDGRISYPLCFIFSSPAGCKPEQQMMYAGSKNRLVQAAELTKVFEIRTTEDLTEEWLRERLAFFR
ncbi:glia maturation factor gamma isoform X1 [Pelodiscus sinensis]|uniref:glia maturation factor gamma isoform X1 n=1 Tax=Pelodiscus sinensis TaxID=13735 RepID=UPI003F6AB701